MKEVLTVRVQFSKDLQYKWHFKILSKLHKASKIEKKFKYNECCKFNFKHLNASPKFQNKTKRSEVERKLYTWKLFQFPQCPIKAVTE